jgi:hypothetical protein
MLREKIANLRLPITNQPNSKYRYIGYDLADQIHKEYMAWFLSKLKPLSDEEIDKRYVASWAERNTSVDSPLELKQTKESDNENIY